MTPDATLSPTLHPSATASPANDGRLLRAVQTAVRRAARQQYATPEDRATAIRAAEAQERADFAAGRVAAEVSPGGAPAATTAEATPQEPAEPPMRAAITYPEGTEAPAVLKPVETAQTEAAPESAVVINEATEEI